MCSRLIGFVGCIHDTYPMMGHLHDDPDENDCAGSQSTGAGDA